MAFRSPRLTALCSVTFALFAVACGDSESTKNQGGAGGTTTTSQSGGGGGTAGSGGENAETACKDPFISKGPWVLAVTTSAAKVRWEACKTGTLPELTFTEEGASAETTATANVSSMTLTETYKAPLNTQAPPDYAGSYDLFEASLSGLKEGTCYAYSLKADPNRKGRFCTAHPSGEAFSFMAIGDTNPGLGHTKGVLENALSKKPEFTLHGGDIQYYDSGLETWASWFPVMQPMLSEGAFFPAIGNHESEKSEELAEYALRFFGGAGFDGGETYYRFSNGGVYFFSLNTEENIGQGSAQATWLEAALVEATTQPGFRFSVVFFHRPLVTCGDTGDNVAAREFLEPIFNANGVLLVFQAHMHGYERFEIPGSPTYITTAGGGGLMGKVDENIERAYCVDRVSSAPAYHAMIFEVGTTMLKGMAIDETGSVIDSFDKPVQ